MIAHDAVLRLAMHREGCVNPKPLSTRQLWRITYRNFRTEARGTRRVEKQLEAFRGFAKAGGAK